jgi:TatA/E family protein of Tat protein translocase
MFGFGFQELLVILIIALIVFGPAKLPQIGSGLGKAIRDFRKSMKGDGSEEEKEEHEKSAQENERRLGGKASPD